MSMILIIRLRFKTAQGGLSAKSQEGEKECVLSKDFKVTE